MAVKEIEDFIKDYSKSIMFTMKAIARQSKAIKYDDQVACLILDIKDKSKIAHGYNTCDDSESIEVLSNQLFTISISIDIIVSNVYDNIIEYIRPSEVVKHAEINAIEDLQRKVDRYNWDKSYNLIAFVSKKPCDNCMEQLSKYVSYVVYKDKEQLYLVSFSEIKGAIYSINILNIPEFTLNIPEIEYLYKL